MAPHFSFSANTKSKDVSVIPINKKISELTEEIGFNPELISNVKHSLKQVGCDIEQIILKETAIEGLGAGVEAALGPQRVGAKANTQMDALRLIFETPTKELTLKFKRGLGIGAELGSTTTKDGRPGTMKEKKISFGTFEVYIQDKKSAEPNPAKNSNTLVQQTSSLTAPKARAQEFIKQQEKKAPSSSTSKNSKQNSSKKVKQGASSLKINQEESLLLDQTVEEVVSHFHQDADVLKLYDHYQKNENRAVAFKNFQNDLNEQLNKQKRVDELIAASTATSFF